MRQLIITTVVVLAMGASFSGCERNDYQHPMYRSTK